MSFLRYSDAVSVHVVVGGGAVAGWPLREDTGKMMYSWVAVDLPTETKT